MFIYIRHGDNEQFLLNSNCPVVILVQYLKRMFGLAESELVDLCDERGVLKFLFQPQNLQESARELLKARESFIVCIVHCMNDGAFTSVRSLLAGVDSALLEALQSQIDHLEKARLKQLHSVESRAATSEENSAQALPAKTTKKRKKVTHVNGSDEGVQRHTEDRKSRN
ncbi:uncharacterized protein CXorf65 homolog isoform X1 [Danio rerio]|uniref:Si:ch211-191o15.6 n=4 Tax=Danio rerio TaxID=7955 RepID=E7F5W4_DANRE|nr:uncharacterized protein CXorf65 homolog [Danio rerio]|eukprot:XP_706556.2 uncharacterized protein CXorf65 homolog [Danio rerio]